MSRNPFDEKNPQKEIKGENIINVRTQKVVRIIDQNGNEEDIITEIHDSRPDESGGYIDSNFINYRVDQAGNPHPEDPCSVIRSHSGLFISSQDQRSHCTSFFHFSPNRNVLLGQDGRATPSGAICSRCDFWLNTFYIVLGIFGIGLIIGLYKGTYFF